MSADDTFSTFDDAEKGVARMRFVAPLRAHNDDNNVKSLLTVNDHNHDETSLRRHLSTRITNDVRLDRCLSVKRDRERANVERHVAKREPRKNTAARR